MWQTFLVQRIVLSPLPPSQEEEHQEYIRRFFFAQKSQNIDCRVENRLVRQTLNVDAGQTHGINT